MVLFCPCTLSIVVHLLLRTNTPKQIPSLILFQGHMTCQAFQEQLSAQLLEVPLDGRPERTPIQGHFPVPVSDSQDMASHWEPAWEESGVICAEEALHGDVRSVVRASVCS